MRLNLANHWWVRKRSGPRTAPRGTPDVTDTDRDASLDTITS